MTVEKLAATLPTVLDLEKDETGEYVEVQKPVPWFIEEDGNLAVTTETEVIVGDYWGEFFDPLHISDKLVAWADENGGHWEWYNAAYFVFFRD